MCIRDSISSHPKISWITQCRSAKDIFSGTTTLRHTGGWVSMIMIFKTMPDMFWYLRFRLLFYICDNYNICHACFGIFCLIPHIFPNISFSYFIRLFFVRQIFPRSLHQNLLHRHKRIPLLFQFINDRKCRFHRGFRRIMPVSYTHLDVYKRQDNIPLWP